MTPRSPGEPSGPTPPLRDPIMTNGEVRRAAARLLPGARFRRRLWFRYTLVWTKPYT